MQGDLRLWYLFNIEFSFQAQSPLDIIEHVDDPCGHRSGNIHQTYLVRLIEAPSNQKLQKAA